MVFGGFLGFSQGFLGFSRVFIGFSRVLGGFLIAPNILGENIYIVIFSQKPV